MLPVLNETQSNNLLTENNLAIIGSRGFNNFTYAKKEILDIIQKNKISITKIISGGASGADKIAEIFASKFNIPIEVIPADWDAGKHAGVMRNTDIIKKSNYVIAFWDGKSKGTLDSINKAKKLNKTLFIVRISPENINEGVSLNDDGSYNFDFKNDNKTDILSLKYNKDYITTKKTNGLISYYSYKANKNIDKDVRLNLLKYIKSDLQSSDQYEQFLNKAVLGLFNNPNIEVGDVDLILIPESNSNLNFDLANKVKNKIPNALFLKDGILKNEIENVSIDYELMKQHGYKQEAMVAIEKMIKNAIVDGVFKMKKIAPRFRQYALNFLKLDDSNRRLLNKLTNGKVIIIDDIISAGTTFKEINRLVETYAPSEIILFSLIA